MPFMEASISALIRFDANVTDVVYSLALQNDSLGGQLKKYRSNGKAAFVEHKPSARVSNRGRAIPQDSFKRLKLFLPHGATNVLSE